VVDGKVYFGAGDDGVYCVDAETGKEVWHYPGLHVDTSPTVASGKVFGGSGYGTRYYYFCLDAATGKPLWREEWKHPVFGSPTVSGDKVFFGAGNGNMLQSDGQPAGALLCVHTASGKLAWPAFEVADSVLTKPAVDGKHVTFGARDGYVYCLRQHDGKLAWKKDLGSPVVSSPALAVCKTCGHASTLYAAAFDGKLFCLDPDSGEEYWMCALPANLGPNIISSPCVSARKDGQRCIYFGAVITQGGEQFGALYCVEDRLNGAGHAGPAH
jgi:outer membrane protein assembly factor BamB